MSQFEDNNPFAQEYSSTPPVQEYNTNSSTVDNNNNSNNDDDNDINTQPTTTTTTTTITDAGKSQEGSTSSYISYTIRSGDLTVRRRYSEFESLRNCLVRLFPTLIIPPIPEKHSLSDYAAAPTKAKQDTNVIDHRRRMLTVFLNRCLSMDQVKNSIVFHRFLDPNVSWSQVLNSPPVSSLPKSILQADPIDPASTSEPHSYLPIPGKTLKLDNDNSNNNNNDDFFYKAETQAKQYKQVISSGLQKANRRIQKRYIELLSDFEQLGAVYNVYSLNEQGSIASAIEKIGQAIDTNYMTSADLIANLSQQFTEPLCESVQFASIVKGVLKYRRQKAMQLEMTRTSLNDKQVQLNHLQSAENSAQRISSALERLDTSDAPAAATPDDATTTTSESATSPPPPPTTSGFKIPGFGKLNHAIHGIIDVDPVATRRNNIGKIKEQIIQCQQALQVAESDLSQASQSIKQDIARFQATKEKDLKNMLIQYAKCHIEWANKNLQAWKEAEVQVDDIIVR